MVSSVVKELALTQRLLASLHRSLEGAGRCVNANSFTTELTITAEN